MPKIEHDFILYATYATVLEFNIYFFIKFIGYGTFYMRELINKIDLLIFVFCDIGIVLDLTDITPISYAIGISFHMAKNLRWLKLIKDPKISVIVDSIRFILPSLLSTCILLVIFMVIYTVFGIQLFWNVKYYDALNESSNFRSFGKAFLSVLTSATGEGWSELMHSLANTSNDCVNGIQSYEDIQKMGVMGCGTLWAYPYFISFIIAINLIGIKMLSVIVLGGYMESVNENYSIITAEDFEKFLDKWAIYDPQATGWISVEGLIYLFFSLDPPIGVYAKTTRNKMWNTYKKMKKVVSLTNGAIMTLDDKIGSNEEFILHKNEGCVFERRRVIKLLKELEIPLEVDTWRVHFRDVCKNVVVRAIRIKNKNNFL